MGITFSFFSFHRASNDTPETLTTLNVTPPISPFALPFLPKPAIKTSERHQPAPIAHIPSFSSIKFKQPSFGTKLVTLHINRALFVGRILLPILNQLHTNTLSHSRVGLF